MAGSKSRNVDYYLEGGSYETFTLRHFIYSGQELRNMLLDAGFAHVGIHGGYDGSLFDGSQRIVAVARREQVHCRALPLRCSRPRRGVPLCYASVMAKAVVRQGQVNLQNAAPRK